MMNILSSFPDTPLGRAAYSDFVEAFKKDYAIQDDGYQPCTQFTGMNLHWEGKYLYIDQPAIIDKILERYNFADSESSYTPAIAKTLVSTRDCPAAGLGGDNDRKYMKDKPYRQCVGDLLWLARVYRYAIQYAVNACSRVGNNPGPKHWQALCKILRYLNHTKRYRMVYKGSTNTHSKRTDGYCDSDWAPNYGTYFDNYRSTSGEIIGHNGHPLL